MTSRLKVVTLPGDVHAAAVEWALADRGVETEWMCLTDFPARTQYSFGIDCSIDDSPTNAILPDQNCEYAWIRRIGRSPAVPEGLDPRDHALCKRESERFFWGLVQAMAPDAWWVNPLESFLANRNNKLKQLLIARRSGLSIPKTLASNNPTHIRDFVSTCGNQGVISKPFFPHLWNGSDGSAHEYMSSMVHTTDLQRSEALQASPLIYQGFVQKAYELRVVFFGQACIAAKLISEHDPDLAVDWRHPSKHPKVEPYIIPDSIRERCLKVMTALGLIHGSFDFIVTPDGDFVFLEVNESGQCLWLEEECPDLPILSCLTGLFLEKSPRFHESISHKYPYRYSNYLESESNQILMQRTRERHLPGSTEGIMFEE